MKNIFDDLLSLKEAADMYKREESTLRRAIAKGRLIEGQDCKKFGKQWVIKKSAMQRIYVKRKGEDLNDNIK